MYKYNHVVYVLLGKPISSHRCSLFRSVLCNILLFFQILILMIDSVNSVMTFQNIASLAIVYYVTCTFFNYRGIGANWNLNSIWSNYRLKDLFGMNVNWVDTVEIGIPYYVVCCSNGWNKSGSQMFSFWIHTSLAKWVSEYQASEQQKHLNNGL